MNGEQKKQLYENLSWIKSTEPMDDLLGEALMSLMGLVPEGRLIVVDTDHRKEARGVALAWLGDNGHLPRGWR